MQAIAFLQRELSPRGRLSRGGFLLRHALLLPPGLFLCIALSDELGATADLPAAAVLTFALAAIWARRLHDRGRSAAWLLLVALPVAGPLYLAYQCALRGSAPHAGPAGSPGRAG